MIRDIRQFFKALTSNTALEEAYEFRRKKVLNTNNRSAFTIVVVTGILLGLLAFIAGMIFVDRDTISYLESRNRVQLLNGLNQDWKFSQTDDCLSESEKCFARMGSSEISMNIIPLLKIGDEFRRGKETQYLRMSLTIPEASWRSMSSYLTLVLSFPRMTYNQAIIYLNGKEQRKFFLSRPLHIPFLTRDFSGKSLDVDIILEIAPDEPFKIGLTTPTFISTQREYEKFIEYEILKTSGRGDWIALVSRMTLALFAIGLFLLVDSSSESLALALFMGFEALGIAAKQGWLPLSWLGPWWDIFAAALFNNMGLVLRLYFYFNLARIGGSSLSRWMMGSGLWAIPMAVYAMFSANKLDTNYQPLVNFTTLTVSTLGAIVCLRSYTFIRNQDLRWRHLALASGALASVPSIVLSLDSLYPNLVVDAWLVNTLKNLQFNSGFVLALSAFFNISSLENRVRALTAVQTKAKQLEMELELGRSVQKQQMIVPDLPSEINVDYFQSAASYVSGDTIFLHWDQERKVFTAILNDVTGHGVHAALKATVCNVMADLVWSKGLKTTDQNSNDSKLPIFNNLICNYLQERFHTKDMHSICGIELMIDQGKAIFYRSNAPFPIIIQPHAKNSESKTEFSVINLALKNDTPTSMELNPGAILVLMSDGITFSSRQQAHIIKELTRIAKDTSGPNLTINDIKAAVTKYAADTADHIDDDKTIVLLQWLPEAVSNRTPKIA